MPAYRIVFAIGLITALFSPARAGSESLSSLTWDEARKMAGETNPTLEAQRESLEQARYNYQAARATYWPTVSGSAGYTRSDSDSQEGDAADRTSMGVSAQYNLFSGFADQARVHQSEAALNRATADWTGAQADVSATLRRAFLRLLYAQERVALAKSIAERRGQNLDLVQLRFDSGSENRGSLLRTKATASRAAADLEQAQRGVAVQQRELSNALGQSDKDSWIVQGDWTSTAPESDPAWKDLARGTPSVRAAEANIESSRAALVIARGTIYPEVSLRGGIDRSGDDWPPDNDAWSIGASLSVPLFTGGQNINKLSSAKAALRQSEAQLETAEQSALLDLKTAWTNLRNEQQSRAVQAEFLEAARVRAEIAREQYANGLLSFQNWDQIEDELIQSQQSLLSSDRDAAIAEAEWDRVRGISIIPLP